MNAQSQVITKATLRHQAANWKDVRLHKRWWTPGDSAVCEQCAANAAAGWIPAHQDFPSGDKAPPAHDGCRCTLEMTYLRKEADHGRDA